MKTRWKNDSGRPPLPAGTWAGYTCIKYNVVLLLFLLLSLKSEAAVHYVNGGLETDPVPTGQSWATAWTSIDDAMAAATEGDEIWVAQGVYKEFVVLKNGVALYGGFNGTETNLDQRNFTWNITTIFGDGGTNTNNVVTIENATNTLTRLDGFNIEKNPLTVGSAIYTTNASPWIANNRIVGLSNSLQGAVYCSGGKPVITYNTLANNGIAYFDSTSLSQKYLGGGIKCDSTEALIIRNIIVGNMAQVGGGIYVEGGSPRIEGNTVNANAASSFAGGICCWKTTDAVVINNIVNANMVLGSSSTYSGAGISAVHATNVLIANNVILGNSITFRASLAPRGGSGVYCGENSSGKIVNNTVLHNRGGDTGGIYGKTNQVVIANNIVAYNSSGIGGALDLPLFNNCIFDNGTANLVNIPIPPETNGNLFADPALAGDAWYPDWHLLPESPCRSMGSISFVANDWTDIDGEPREWDRIVDIGADAFQRATPELKAPVFRVATTGDDRNAGTDWQTPMRTVQAALDRAAVTGGEVWVAEGTYPERIIMRHAVYLYGGFAGTETNRSQRDWKAHTTILDGQRVGSVVSFYGVQKWNCVDGFTIQNGCSTIGGGIYARTSSPMIENNRIINNIATNASTSIVPAGGGVGATNSTVVISNNIIENNFCKVGAGVALFDGSGDLVTRNTFTLNRSVITNNTPTTYLPGGAALNATRSSVKINNNLFSCNITTNYYTQIGYPCMGGAILLTQDGSSPDKKSSEVRNNSFIANFALGTLDGGGGVSMQSCSNTVCANNLFNFNSSAIYSKSSVDIHIFNNCVNDNTVTNYGGMTNPTGINGNIAVNPFLARLPYPYLMSSSPCIDAGSSNLVTSDELDWAGNPRVAGVGVDIGAIESSGTIPDLPRLTYHASTNGADSQDGLTWATAKRTVQAAIDAASGFGGEVWVAQGTYPENIHMGPFVYVYGGFNGSETALAQRNWQANPTILDGKQRDFVVSIYNAGPYSALSGFTITKGRSVIGGGVWCRVSSPWIAFNRIIANRGMEKGGGIICESSAPTIYNNIVAFNTNTSRGMESGGGITLKGCPEAKIIQNTVVSNRSETFEFTAAIYTSNGGLLINNLIAYNYDSGIQFNFKPKNIQPPILSNNCVFGHVYSNYFYAPKGVGDITNNPMLVPGTFELSADSPCIDAGNDEAVTNALDLLGQPRISGAHVDIGAFEYAAPGQWGPLVPDPSALSLSPVTVGGITYVAYGFEFAEAQCRVQNIAAPVWDGTTATVDLPLEQWTGRDIQGTNRLSGTLVLGTLKPGAYVLAVKVSGSLLKTVPFEVPEASGSTLAWQPRQTGESLKLQVQGVAGVSYRLLASTNLVDWESVATNHGAPFEFDIPVETNRPARFYRVEVAP